MDAMKKYLYTLRADLIFSAPVTEHAFLLRVTPPANAVQEPMRESVTCQPTTRLSGSRDGLGNWVSYGNIAERHSSFSFCAAGEVLIDSNRRETDGAAPFYRFPTSLTQLTGALSEYFVEHRKGGSIDEKVENWMLLLNTDFRYQKGVTKTSTSSAQAWDLGCGVCQDYAHILLTLLRGEFIPCRYVAGLMVGEGASHAWVEYFNGSEWISVDPTHARICGDEYMKISHGPDFNSCSLERGIFHGNAEQTMLSKASLLEI